MDLLPIFVHVPKSGGMSLRNVFDCVYGKNNVYDAFDEPDFTRLPVGAFDHFHAFFGHRHFGLHERTLRPYQYFTLLRDPLERAHSNWWYIRTHTTHRNYNEALKAKSALEFQQMGADPWSDNGLVKMFAGVDPRSIPFGKVTRELYATARENLSECVVTRLEDDGLNRLLVLLCDQLDWRMLPFCPQKINVGANKPAFPEEDRAALFELVELDCDLYNSVQATRLPAVMEFHLDLLKLLHDTAVKYWSELRAAVPYGCRDLTVYGQHTFTIGQERGEFSRVDARLIANYLARFNR